MQMRTLRLHFLATFAALVALSASADDWIFNTANNNTDYTFAAGTYSGGYIRVGRNSGSCNVTLGSGATLTVTNARIGNYDSSHSGDTAIFNIAEGATFNESAGYFFIVLDHPGTGYVNLNGGTMDVSAPIYIGACANAMAALTVNAGTAVFNDVDLGVRYDGNNTAYDFAGSKAKFVMTGGEVAVTNHFEIGGNVNSTGTTVVDLNGGSLSIRYFKDGKLGKAILNFNGTTIKPRQARTDFLEAFSNLACNIQSGNLIVDTDYDITIAAPLTGVGGIVKKGSGTLTLTGNNTFTGAITVEEGAGAVVKDNNTVGPFVLDGSNGGNLGTVQLHGDRLEGWLTDSDITTFKTIYGGDGLHTYELPRIIAVKNGDTTVAFTNLEVGATVNWTAGDKSGTFTTESLAPRTIMIPVGDDTIDNVRDMGGWPLEGTTTAGRTTVKQGQLFRGGRLDAFYSLTDAEKAANMLHTQLASRRKSTCADAGRLTLRADTTSSSTRRNRATSRTRPITLTTIPRRPSPRRPRVRTSVST